jgi:hypothetical protein
MDSIYVFKYVPSSVKRLIYLYLVGLGTPTSKLIKEEYDKLFEANKHNIIVYPHMSMYQDKDIGFMGLREVIKASINKFFKRTPVPFEFYKKYTGDIGTKLKEDLLLPKQLYETDVFKIYYVYNCSNANKYNIMISLLADSAALTKLFKYKILQLNSEEESKI